MDDDVVDDDEDGLPDEPEELSEEELMSVQPVRLILTKVTQLKFNKHQSTNQQRDYTTASRCISVLQTFLIFLSRTIFTISLIFLSLTQGPTIFTCYRLSSTDIIFAISLIYTAFR
jgi:hypothetical protein